MSLMEFTRKNPKKWSLKLKNQKEKSISGKLK